MDIQQVLKYWTDIQENLHKYNFTQLSNPRLSKATIDFLITCGLPESCAPGLSFDNYNELTIPTPNEVFKIDNDELNDFLMIGSNGSGDPVCIDSKNENEIVYLNHDNDFEKIFMNSSAQKLAECIIRYSEFNASLNARFENNAFLKRKFSDEEFSQVCSDFNQIDDRSLQENACWKQELDCLLWERDNE